MIPLRASANVKQLSLVFASLILGLAHFGPLAGSLAALFLTVGGQVYLLGFLGARALGLLRDSASLLERLTWIVIAGLGISIVLGAAARLLLVPVSLYVVGLHLIMVALCFAPAAPLPRLRFERRALPHYALLALACALFALVGWERNRLRFDGYEDQTLVVSLADWWAHHTPPENLVSRNIAETNDLTYWSSDGLTYVLAAWVWTGGFSAAQLIWYALTPLFAWLVPVAHFSLAKKITGRDDTAAWTTAFVLLLALTTADGVTRFSGFWEFGQQAAFQLDTLRTFAAALMLPLALFAFYSYLRAPNRRGALIAGVFILAMALIHPRQFLVVITAVYGVLAVWCLVMPSRARLRQTGLIGLVLLPGLLIPVWQYSPMLLGLLSPAPVVVSAAPVAAAPEVLESTAQLPLIGQVIDPRALFYHPFIVLALILGLASVAWLRRSLAAQLSFTTCVLMLALNFFPPVFHLMIRLLGGYYGIRFVLGFVLVVPVGLILGIALAAVHDRLTRRGGWLIAAALAAAALALLFEPFPIAQSARDQIAAATEMQALRDIQPFDEALIDALRALPLGEGKVVYLTPNRLASFVIESVPDAVVTGGRDWSNPAFAGSSRFYDPATAPWIDPDDLSFLRAYAVNYVVVAADSTRLPQLILEADRFERVASAAGSLVFRVRNAGAPSALDRAFGRMNALYRGESSRRWDADGFHLSRGVDAARWQSLIADWRAQLARDPDNDLIRYGLAFASLMAGDDQPDLWASLSAAHPDVFALTDAYAHVLREHGQPQQAVDALAAHLDAPDGTTRVLAARSLLTEPFFYLLTSAQLDKISALAQADATTWAQFIDGDGAANLRQRAALLMSAGRLDEAARWLERIAPVEVSPNDLVTRAAVALAGGDAAAARAILQPATDADWVVTRANLHPERWTPDANAAALMAAALGSPDGPLPDAFSPLQLANGGLFAQGTQVDQAGSTLTVTALVGSFTPALAVREVVAQVVSPDSSVVYGQAVVPVDVAAGTFARVAVSVDLPADLPPLTPARVLIRPRYSPAVVYTTPVTQAVLNRPTGVRLPADAQPVNLRFGDRISLVGYTTDVTGGALDLTLYWQTDTALAEDDQVTVQVFDAAGAPQAQHDSAPANDAYPTRFWLPNTLIADPHRLALPPGSYDVRVGLYGLPGLTRLTITPPDERVQDDLLRLTLINVAG